MPSPLGLLTSLSSWCLLVFDIKNRRLSGEYWFVGHRLAHTAMARVQGALRPDMAG